MYISCNQSVHFTVCETESVVVTVSDSVCMIDEGHLSVVILSLPAH